MNRSLPMNDSVICISYLENLKKNSMETNELKECFMHTSQFIQNNKKTCPQGPEFNGLIFLENALIRDILKCHFLLFPV